MSEFVLIVHLHGIVSGNGNGEKKPVNETQSKTCGALILVHFIELRRKVVQDSEFDSDLLFFRSAVHSIGKSQTKI